MACAAPIRLKIHSSETRFLSLTKREKLICRRLAQGFKPTEIAQFLGITEWALEAALKRARRRECATDTLRLVVRYLEEYCGLLEPLEDLPERPDTDPTPRESDAAA